MKKAGRNDTADYGIVFDEGKEKSLIWGGDIITQKQRRFADEYAKLLNGTKAYMKVYGTNKAEYAARKACELKKKPEIKKYIDKRLEAISKRARVDAQRVLELLAAVAFTSPAEMARLEQSGGKQRIVWNDFDTLDESVRCAIKEIKNTPSGICVEMMDRMKAMDMLMKYLGMNKQEKTGVYFEGEGDIE